MRRLRRYKGAGCHCISGRARMLCNIDGAPLAPSSNIAKVRATGTTVTHPLLLEGLRS